jgi:hypothetical protein
MPRVRSEVELWKDYPGAPSDWICIEYHVELNTADPFAADGTEEFWINDVEESPGLHNQDMRGTYTQYGINQIAFDNYWNPAGPPSANEVYRDNIVISTERIFCEVGAIADPPDPTPTATPTNVPPTATPTATPTDVPPTPTATPTTDPSDPTGVLP